MAELDDDLREDDRRLQLRDDVEGEKETIFAMRMQFYAIEIVRNRAGLNDWIYEQEHPEEKQTS